MKKLLSAAFALTIGISAAMAVPAKPGVKKVLTLKDGTRIEAALKGDEHVHFYQTQDGRAIQLGQDGYQYVNRDSLVQLHQQRLDERNRIRASRRAVGPRKTAYKGQRKGLVILVQFSDVKFTYDKETFNDYFNKTGYDSYGMKGSVHDYFLAQSYGQFDLEFDVVGPVTLTQKATYYGYDQSTKVSQNQRVALMVNTICRQVDSEVDYSKYDWDDDGEVDQVYVIYAGYGAAQGADHTIWPHEWNVRGGVANPYKTAEGVTIGTYGISCELMGDGTRYTGQIDGIGTSCHEFSHCLGLPDFYDTDNSKSTSNFGMSYWDLMDTGCYNGSMNGNSPCGYTAYERWHAGWLEPVELASSCQVVDMPAIQDAPVAYIVYNDALRNEYYLLENYQQKGFDAAGRGHGMLVLHVDYSQSAWTSNTVNQESTHQRMTIIAADNNYSSTVSSLAGDPFPGTRLKTALTNTSSPRSTLYNANVDGKKLMNKPITDITEENGMIMFNFMGGIEVETPLVHEPTGVTGTGFTASWDAVEGIQDYTVSLTQTIDGSSQGVIDVFEEDFEGFKADVQSSDVSKTLDKYTALPGWSGKNLYASPYKLRVGKSGSVGELETPFFEAPLHDTLSIFIAPVSTSRLSAESLQLRLYISDGGYLYADIDNLPLLGSDEAGMSYVLRTPWTYGSFSLGVYPGESGNGIYMDYLAAFDGYVNLDDEDFSPTQAPSKNVKCLDASQIQWKSVGLPENLAQPRQRRAQRVTTTFFNTTDTHYTFSDLEPAVYSYKVRANTDTGVSPWSDEIVVDLITAIRSIADDATRDSKLSNGEWYYDLSGRRVQNPVRGLYIHGGRKVVVR